MLNPFKKNKKQSKQDLIKDIKKEFPEKKKDLLNNKMELLHIGLNEGNDPWVENFLYDNSQLSVVELAIIDKKDEEELSKAIEAKARVLDLYSRWKDLQ